MVKIEVKAVDIKRGDPGSSRWCPVALALKRAYPEAWNVEADIIRLHVDMAPDTRDGHPDCRTKTTPRQVATFIKRFDEGKPVKPFSFRF